MGTDPSALLAHLAGICLSGQVTEVLLGGHRPASEAARREQAATRDDAAPMVLLPTATRLEPWTALRLLHRGNRECVLVSLCVCGSLCVCVCTCVRGRGQTGGQLWTPLSIRHCCPLPPTAPQHEKHICLSGSFHSASWFTSILLHSCLCQEQQGFGQAPSVISDGIKFSFTCSAGNR